MYRKTGRLRDDVLPRVVWMVENKAFAYADPSRPDQTNGGGSRVVLWQTPSSSSNGRKPSGELNLEGQARMSAVNQQWPTPRGYSHQDSNRPGINQLDAEVRQLPSAKLKWSTPRAEERQQTNSQDGYVALSKRVSDQWAMPNSRDWKGSPSAAMEGQKSLPRDTTKTNKSGQLNPRWVETLMGLPIGWTTPSCARPWTVVLMNCGSSATGLTPMS